MSKESVINIFKTLFKHYYRTTNLIEIPHIEQREFAFQLFNSSGMIRHLSFRSIEDLRRFLIEKVPAHVYYSAAYYKYPDNPDMDSKIWLGCDLIFDIDADHLDTKNCRGVELMTLECLNDAYEELQKLIDVLLNEFGFSMNEVKVVFSGHRGFHVHIESDVVKNLGPDERREIVDYLLAKGFNIDFLIRIEGKSKKLIVNLTSPGYGGRIAKVLYEIYSGFDSEVKSILEGLSNVKLKKTIIDSLKSLEPTIVDKLRIKVDEIVTMDIKRLIRVPGSLHGKTGLIVLPLDKQTLDRGIEYIVDKAIAFRKGTITVRFVKKLNVRRVLGEDLGNVDIGTVMKLPIHLGLYLIGQGYCELHE